MVTIHRTTKEEITQLAVALDKPRSPYDDLLDDVAQGQPMRVEGSESKVLRGAKIAISRLAKRRGVPITYQALTNGPPVSFWLWHAFDGAGRRPVCHP